MKKLVCAKEIEALVKEGKKVCYIDADTIVTPGAKDAAATNGVEFSTEAPTPCESAACTAAPAATAAIGGNQVDKDMIYQVLKAMMDKGMLDGIIDNLNDGKPYASEKDANGLKVVRGNSIKYDFLETEDPSNQVYYQEVINADDGSSMNAGMITIEKCNFGWLTECQEIYHVVEGTLHVTVGDKVYVANPGDSVFFPKGVQVTFGSPNKMKAFYSTY